MKILHISDPLGRHAELTNLPEDEDRTNFLIEIPCRVGFDKKNGPTNGPLTEKVYSLFRLLNQQKTSCIYQEI